MAKKSGKFSLDSKYKGLETNIWIELNTLNDELGNCVNLGQGFPDYQPAPHIVEYLAEVCKPNPDLYQFHQYARAYGHPRLVKALASLYGGLIGIEIDPFNEVIVCGGAYGALFYTIMANIGKGDEVIIIEPFFDCYEPMVQLAGGTPRYISLKPKESISKSSGEWVLDMDELESMFNEKTKAIILNTPNNPLGKVFSRGELEDVEYREVVFCKMMNTHVFTKCLLHVFRVTDGKGSVFIILQKTTSLYSTSCRNHVIGNLCIKHDVLVVSDEVYEWIVYEGEEHVRIASLPGMWERTVTIGSAGKTFSLTGWKLGWAYGPSDILRNLQVAHQNCTYMCQTPEQEAVAVALENEFSLLKQVQVNSSSSPYLVQMKQDLTKKRDISAKAIADAGMIPIIPQGGYFMMANWSSLKGSIVTQEKLEKEGTTLSPIFGQCDDVRFVIWLAKHRQLLGVPPSAFYSCPNKALGKDYIRFNFYKKMETLQKAAKILCSLKNS